ncbi:unconventional myosin-XVI-like [Perca flavescens]|uniref:unconventional myosin-XVI-like n=1 Tax=Perca flavescens TaxID=8167 RepID=UPI00106DDCC3|nr:unconventional myosin-XVI-like [Perca flavescens]
MEKWKRSCETSDLNSDTEPSKRQSKKNPLYSSSKDMSDTAPPPPKPKIKKAARAQPPAPTSPPPPVLWEKTAMAQLGAGQDRPNEADHNPPPMPCDDLPAVLNVAMAPWSNWTDEAAHLLPMPSGKLCENNH